MQRRVLSSRRLCFAAAVLLLLVLSACSATDPGNALEPVGPAARMEADLFNLIFWIAVVVFVAVEGLLVYTVIRFRHRPTDRVPVQTHGNTPLEIAWTIVPCIILAIIAIPTLTTIASATATPTGPNAIKVKVVGHQFWWEFDYPDLGVVTSDEMHIPVNTPVALDIESADLTHSFWVPKLGGKVQAIPNQHNSSWIQADQVGEFRGQCFQLCGFSHANMRFIVVSESRANFDQWVASQKAPPAQPASPDAQKGEQTFMTGACVGCHTINGTNAKGTVGPNLTHIGSHTTIAGAVLQNNPQDLATWLRDPPAVKPGNDMPNLNLNSDQINALVAYMQSLK
jgi:cytochrome c oxidase subunit II